MKDYSGNQFPYLYILFDESDRERVLPVVEAMEGRGIRFCGIEKQNAGKARKALAAVAFLSEKFVQDERRTEDFFAVKDSGVPMIPVMLDNFVLPEIMQQAMYAKNSLMADRYPMPEALAQRILTAEVFANPTVTPAQKKASRLGLAGLCACAAVVLGLTVFALRPEEEPAPVVEEVVQTEYELPFGMTQKDLEAVRYAIIIGEHHRFVSLDEMNNGFRSKTCEEFGHRQWTEDGVQWYWNEDNSEVTMTEYDLGFLELFPNLLGVQMAKVRAQELPDLSGQKNLKEVQLFDCEIPDIGGIAGAAISKFVSENTAVRDYGPLSDCPKLNSVFINLNDADTDFTAFGPKNLARLEIYNNSGADADLRLDGLQNSVNLRELTLTGLLTQNLDFLDGLISMNRLKLQNMPQLWDISAIGLLRNLEGLEIWDTNALYDVTPVGQCIRLKSLQLGGMPASDFRFMDNLISLTEIGLHAQQTNLDFLRCLKNKNSVNLYFSGPIQDFSALASINSFNYLHVNLWNRSYHELVEPYLENCIVYNTLNLYDCRDVRLDHLPKINQELYIQYGDLKNLEGMPERIFRVRLENMQQLVSLKGLENDNSLTKLTVNGCLRLKDWSALDGLPLSELSIGGIKNLPDFENITVNNTLTLDSIPELTELSCLEKLPNKKLNLCLPGMDGAADLSALKCMEGWGLSVPPELEIQAMKLVENGKFRRYEIVFPEGDWRNDLRFSLQSMEDLETLPEAVLKQVTRLYILGDTVYDPDVYELWDRWEGNRQIPFLHNRETGENIQVKEGSIRDFSVLEKLTGLRELIMMYQPLQNLEGIQNMSSLWRLEVNYCQNLTDISQAFTLDTLTRLSFYSTPVDSIQGIQNLHRLESLSMSSTKVSDLSPLVQCDFRHAMEEFDGIWLECNSIPAQDFSPLCNVPKYEWLCFNNLPIDAVEFFSMMEQTEVRGIAVDWLGSQEGFQAMLDAFPGLQRIFMHGNREVKDLTPLLNMSELREVYVSQDMRTQAEQLRAQNPHFTITID